MRLVAYPMILVTSACGQAATDFGFKDFYLNCSDELGEVRVRYYVDEGRRQVSRLDRDGEFYLVCDAQCERVHNDSTLEWTVTNSDGSQNTTRIDRLSGKLESFRTKPNDPPLMIGGVAVPADLLSHVVVLTCEPADGPPEAKF